MGQGFHKTWLGKQIDAIAHFLHRTGPVTVEGVIAMAGDIAAATKVYDLCATAIEGENDPVVIVTKVCACLVEHQSELPDDLKGQHLTATIMSYCSKVVHLDVPAIEAIVRKELGV